MAMQNNYIEQFLMHTQLYIVLSGKSAEELTVDDMDKISGHIDMQRAEEMKSQAQQAINVIQ